MKTVKFSAQLGLSRKEILQENWSTIISVLVILSALTTLIAILPVRHYIIIILAWIRGLGPLGPLAIIFLYLITCILFLPRSIVSLGAGFLFSAGAGLATVSIGSTLGACAAFLVGRTLARKWLFQKVSGSLIFNTLNQAIIRQGFRIILLTRLNFILPFSMLNYISSLTRIPLWKFALASFIGMLPGSIVYVYLGQAAGSLLKAVTGNFQQTPAQQLLFWIGLAVTIIVSILVTLYARRALQQAIKEQKNSANRIPR